MLDIKKIIVYFACKYLGEWDDIFDALKNKEPITDLELEKTYAKCGGSVITIIDDEYPSSLKNIYKPPFALFYKGDISLLNDRESSYLGVVGSREPSSYSIKAVNKVIDDLALSNVIIVSGLAKGIDGVAHEASLRNGLKTIAILGTGIDKCYPKENLSLYEEIKETGLILSEYPFNITKKDSFPKRNRIIAGLSSSLLVGESHQKSGTLISINYAVEQGKDVYCIPSSIFEDNVNNELIKEGAILITNGRDIFEKK